MKGITTLLMVLWLLTGGVATAGNKIRDLQYVKQGVLRAYRETHPKTDSCPASILGAHGVLEWDGYGYFADFTETNHILYYTYNTPDTSLVDSTQPGCQSSRT